LASFGQALGSRRAGLKPGADNLAPTEGAPENVDKRTLSQP